MACKASDVLYQNVGARKKAVQSSLGGSAQRSHEGRREREVNNPRRVNSQGGMYRENVQKDPKGVNFDDVDATRVWPRAQGGALLERPQSPPQSRRAKVVLEVGNLSENRDARELLTWGGTLGMPNQYPAQNILLLDT